MRKFKEFLKEEAQPKVTIKTIRDSKRFISIDKSVKDDDTVTLMVKDRDTTGMKGSQDGFIMVAVDSKGKEVVKIGSHPSKQGAMKFFKNNYM